MYLSFILVFTTPAVVESIKVTNFRNISFYWSKEKFWGNICRMTWISWRAWKEFEKTEKENKINIAFETVRGLT